MLVLAGHSNTWTDSPGHNSWTQPHCRNIVPVLPAGNAAGSRANHAPSDPARLGERGSDSNDEDRVISHAKVASATKDPKTDYLRGGNPVCWVSNRPDLTDFSDLTNFAGLIDFAARGCVASVLLLRRAL